VNRPAYSFWSMGRGKGADIGYHGDIAIEFHRQNVESALTIKATKGRIICLELLGLSRRQRCLVSQGVSNPIWNVALLVPPVAPSQQMRSVSTPRPVHLPVRQVAYCATTLASAVAPETDFRAQAARHKLTNRRRGKTPAAVFC
jgi:hypothetical protein